MGFYSTQSLVDDARRHGVVVRRPDINASAAMCTLKPPIVPGGARSGPGRRPVAVGDRRSGGTARPVRGAHHRRRSRRADRGRTGARAARTATCATWPGALCEHRTSRSRRPTWRHWPPPTPSPTPRGAGMTRREALWAAGAAAQERPDRLPGHGVGVRAPVLPGMDAVEAMVADVWSTGLSPDSHPIEFVREYLDNVGAIPIAAAVPHWRTASGWSSAGWSPIASARPPRAASRSSTWRTRRACSTWSAPRVCGSASAGSPGRPTRC